MTASQLSLNFAGHGHAVLILPHSMTAEALRLLEREIVNASTEVRRNPDEASDDSAEIEYASWLQNLRPALRDGTVCTRPGAQ